MIGRLKRHLTYANVIATVALVVALGGTSYAALRIGSRQIVDDSVRSVDVRNNTLVGKDVRNRSLTGRDVEQGSLGGAEIAEGRLGSVPNALRLQGRLLDQLIVGCPEPARATGGMCIEATPRPPADFIAADGQCAQLRGRLPMFVELLNSSFSLPSLEWTSNILGETGGDATTLLFGNGGISSAPIGLSVRPYRCAFPLSN